MSVLRGFKGGQYQPLSEKDIETIHEGSMYLFEKVGLEVYGRRAFEIFKDKGARVDFETQRLNMYRSMVEDAFNMAPSNIVLCACKEGNGRKHISKETTPSVLG